MTINKIRCAVCGENLSLRGQKVSCNTCSLRGVRQSSGTLTQAILTIEAQAVQKGQTLDVLSIVADEQGHLTFSVKKLANAPAKNLSERVAGRVA